MCDCPNAGLHQRNPTIISVWLVLRRPAGGKTYFFISISFPWVNISLISVSLPSREERYKISNKNPFQSPLPERHFRVFGGNIHHEMFCCLYLFYDNVNLSIPTVNMRNRNVQQIFFFCKLWYRYKCRIQICTIIQLFTSSVGFQSENYWEDPN